MSSVEDLEDQEDKPHVGWVPRVLQGGKGPPEPPVDNWVAAYEIGTTFLSRLVQSRDCDYELFRVEFKDLPDVMVLTWELPDGKVLHKYIEPAIFSKMFIRGKILGVVKEPQEEVKEDTDGNSNRTD